MTQTKTSDQQAAINAQLLNDYFDGITDPKNPKVRVALSVNEVAARYGRSHSSAYRLIRAATNAGRTRTVSATARVDQRRKENQKPLSKHHARLGLMITRWRAERRINHAQCGILFGVSRIRLSQMETGSYNFTLVELAKFCEVLGIKMESVISDEFPPQRIQRRA